MKHPVASFTSKQLDAITILRHFGRIVRIKSNCWGAPEDLMPTIWVRSAVIDNLRRRGLVQFNTEGTEVTATQRLIQTVNRMGAA